jgi:hypothetical protein
LYTEFVHQLDAAFWRGYSIIELSRVLAHANAANLYKIMRDEGIVPMLPKQAQLNKLPHLVVSCLRLRGLGFPQWCNSHGIEDQAMAARVLWSKSTNTSEELQVLKAFRLDFRRTFEVHYQEVADIATIPDPPPESRATKFMSKCVFSHEKQLYVGKIEFQDGHGISVEGPNPKYVMAQIRKKSVLLVSIGKLSILPERIMSGG